MSTPDTQSIPATEPVFVQHKGIYFGFPAFGGRIDSPFAMSLMNLRQAYPDLVAHVECINGDSLVSRARNRIARNFMNGIPATRQDNVPCTVKCDWLLFMDTDLIFSASDVNLLYQAAVKRGPDIYCGTYPIKQLKPKIVFNQMPGVKPDDEGLVEVRESGTGYMLIHRDVFEKMAVHFSDEIRYEADAGNMSVARAIEFDFFSVGVRMDPVYKYKRYLSEDWYFCQRWREMGGKVWLHTKIQAQHIGQITYPVPIKDIIETAQMYRDGLEALDAHNKKMANKEKLPESYQPKREAVAAVD